MNKLRNYERDADDFSEPREKAEKLTRDIKDLELEIAEIEKAIGNAQQEELAIRQDPEISAGKIPLPEQWLKLRKQIGDYEIHLERRKQDLLDLRAQHQYNTELHDWQRYNLDKNVDDKKESKS